MPPDSAPPPDEEGGPVEIVLGLLADTTARGLAMVASSARADLVIEDASVGRAIGRTLHAPDGLIANTGRIMDVSNQRLSLGWTELCGWRPNFIVAEPIPGQARHLIVACAGACPSLHTLGQIAALVGMALEKLAPTRRERDASLRIAALIDNLPLPIVFVDSRTIEVSLNDRARRLLGIGPFHATERDVAVAFARLLRGANLDTRIAENPDVPLEFEIDVDGRQFAVESRWVDDDRLRGRLWMFRDVSQERGIARLKDELVSTVSHELRTPLTSIIGSLGLLRSGTVGVIPDAAATLIDIAQRNGERLALLVNDLLDLDKIGSGKLDLRRKPVDIAALLDEAVAQNIPYATKHGVTLRLSGADSAQPAHVDPDRMLQVIANLLSNAAKFSYQNGVVDVRLSRHAGGLRISVSDSGIGISPEFRDRLFERFAQDGDGGKGRTGTGLGLAISKGIVEQHGGAITLDTGVLQGTTFHIDLPSNDSEPHG